MNLVMDSSALLAYLFAEEGAGIVDDLLMNQSNNCYVHSINLCEIYYNIVRAYNETEADRALENLADTGLIIREDMDIPLWKTAGKIKANLKRVSLTDCLCVALASRVAGEVVTTDHHELDSIAVSGICSIRFIR